MSSSLAERDASASTKYTTGRSERLVEGLKARRFRQIFTYLDQACLSSPHRGTAYSLIMPLPMDTMAGD